jgi:putative flippase GtrA
VSAPGPQDAAATGLVRLCQSVFGQGSVGRYAAIGPTGVALDTGLFAALVAVGVAPLVASLSTPAGICNNYVLNARYNFGTRLNFVHGRRFLIVGLLGLLGLAVAAASLQLLIAAGFSPLRAKLVSLPAVLVSQFLANKLWSFRPPSSAAAGRLPRRP